MLYIITVIFVNSYSISNLMLRTALEISALEKSFPGVRRVLRERQQWLTLPEAQ